MSITKKILFLGVFSLIGLVALSVPFSQLIGAQQTFSLFDFIAPTIGAFLTSVWGAGVVIIVKLSHALITHQNLDTITIIRLFPLALGALYFGLKKYKLIMAIIPLVCMGLFMIHPEGRQAWYYALYWLIPVAALAAKRSLMLNSLGATFTAHAVGGVTFLYAFNLPGEVWIALIPIVFIERVLFAGGIALSYVSLNTLVGWLERRLHMPILGRLTNPTYTFSRAILKNL
ncbi:MAG: hypothetical protein ACOYUK_03110 [Patescibacteria group bacterium]